MECLFKIWVRGVYRAGNVCPERELLEEIAAQVTILVEMRCSRCPSSSTAVNVSAGRGRVNRQLPGNNSMFRDVKVRVIYSVRSMEWNFASQIRIVLAKAIVELEP